MDIPPPESSSEIAPPSASHICGTRTEADSPGRGDSGDSGRLIRLLTETASRFIHLPLPEVRSAIEVSMSELANYLDADRVYVFAYDLENRTCSNTFEWCAPGIRACIDELQDVPIDAFPEWWERHFAGQDVYYPDVSALPEGPLKEVIAGQSIKSLVAVPLIGSAGCTGFIGFDSVRSQRTYEVGELQLLHLFARMLVSIQERQRAEEALSDARRQIENFFDVSIDLLCIVDQRGRFVRVSRAWEDLLGHPAEHLAGVEFMRFVHPDDHGPTLDEFARVRDGQPTLSFVNRYRKGSGAYRYIEWRAKRIGGMIFGSARDITDLKDTEMALGRALDEERQAAALKASLISVASHEFRTPLASIRLAAELLRSRSVPLTAAEADQLLDTVLKTTDHLTEIVGDVLDYNSVQRHMPHGGAIRVDPSEWLEDIASTYRNAHGIRNPLRIHKPKTRLPDLTTNPSLLRRSLINLLENAAKYSPPDSPVALRVSRSGDWLVFRVEDKGIGIPEEAEPHLFDLFYRGPNSKFNRGTGLGLPIAREAVARLGGDLTYLRPTGPGSVFEVRVPLCSDPHPDTP